MDINRMLNELNPAQREAVLTESGPLLVLAGAGTGKTRVVTYRIARLIARGTAADRILAVTFTNKAAAEMQERVQALLGRRTKPRPEISTFHSLCVRILRRQIQHLGYPPTFAIYDQGDQDSLARRVLREINVPGTLLRPSDLLMHIGRWKSASIRPEQAVAVAQTDKEHLAAVAYRRYQKALRAAGALDFDDLLLCTEDLFQQVREARHQEASRFDHILIDEYQDTNRSQYRIVQHLAAAHRNLCVVGDDDQSIYGWRGAEVEHILRFAKDWPGARTVRLEENYRCTGEILQLANRLIRYNRLRHEKTLRAARPAGEKPRVRQYPDETTEAREVVADIRRRLTDPLCEPRDFAILCRTNEQPRAFETELRQAQIPYVLIGGMSFFDRKEVKDILAYLRVLISPEDEPSLLRIINTPPRGISQSAVKGMVDQAVRDGCSVWEISSRAAGLPDVSSHAAEGIDKLRQLIRRYRAQLQQQSLVAVARSLIDEIQYEREIQRLHKDDPEAQQSRWAAVEEVVNALGAYQQRVKKPTLLGFLDEITLSGRELERDKEKQLRRNSVVLMTLHSAKGLEFPHVYMVGMEEGILPHQRSIKADGAAIDEERRLCYVGITRAQERLTMSLALSRMKWGKPRPAHPSRFLFEVTGQADNPNYLAAVRGTHLRSANGRPSASSAPKRRRSSS